MENVVGRKKPLTLTELLRERFKGVLDFFATLFNRLGIRPNAMTLIGLIGNAVGALLLAQGKMLWGGVIILAMGPIDALDGAMARQRGEAGAYGAFVDSVADRYSELIILAGLLYYYMLQGERVPAMLVYAAAVGSVSVSYIRARGASLGYDTKVGLLTRLERYLVLAPSLVVNWPLVGIAIIAVFANFTALQRFIDVRKQARQN